jgi:sugar phosphate isomerase/epimerase
MKTSIFTIIFQHTPLEEALRKIAELGYEGVEIMCKAPHITDETHFSEIERIKGLLDELKLPVSDLATYTGGYSILSDEECQQQLEKLKHYIRVAQLLDCPYIRHWSGGPSIRVAQKYHLEKSVYWFRQAADLAMMHNKKLVMEIHNNSLIETPEAALEFVELVNRPNIGFIFDPGNMYISDVDFGEKAVEMLFDRIFHVHVKDEIRVNNPALPRTFKDMTQHGEEIFQHTLLGEGGCDHLPAIKQLKKMGYRGYFSPECHATPNDYETAKHELAVLNHLIEIA